MNSLFLFDIDNTLLTTSGKKPYKEAIKNIHGINVRSDESFAGLTDPLIFAQLLRGQGWSKEVIEPAIPALLTELERIGVQSLVNATIVPVKGADELLTALRKKGITLGLITGNIKSIAEIKLERVKLRQFFSVGAFGDDPHRKRSDLIRLAIKHAGFTHQLDSVYVVGDTQYDIQSAHDAGVRNSVAVSNGFVNTKELIAAGAKTVIKDFSDTAKVLEKLGII